MTATPEQTEKMLEFGAYVTQTLGRTTGVLIAMLGPDEKDPAYALRMAAATVSIQFMATAAAHPEYYAALVQMTGCPINPDALIGDFPLELTQEVPA